MLRFIFVLLQLVFDLHYVFNAVATGFRHVNSERPYREMLTNKFELVTVVAVCFDCELVQRVEFTQPV